MNTQTPAQGIMLDSDDGDHQVHMWIELDSDQDINLVNMTFYVNTTTPFWKQGFSRFRAAWDILVHGYREDQHTLLLTKQAALNVADTITQVVKELETEIS